MVTQESPAAVGGTPGNTTVLAESIGDDAGGQVALTDLATRINEEHRLCRTAAETAMDHALKAGQLLIEAKGRCEHGAWSTWLGANCEVSDRTARLYMRVARTLPSLPEPKRQRVAVLSLREASKVLAEPKPVEVEEAKPKRWQDIPLEDRREVCTRWPDILASRTIAFDTMGWSVEKIAAETGMPERDVSLVLDPQPPVRFDGEINGAAFLRATPEAIKWYRDAVFEIIEFWMIVHCYGAEYAVECEGFPELVPEIEARRHMHERRYARLNGTRAELCDFVEDYISGMNENLPSRLAWLAAYLCITDDSRRAVGLDGTNPDPKENDARSWFFEFFGWRKYL